MARRPSGVVTFLFTDVEGSTRLWEAHPDDMTTALARHDGLVRDAVTAHDGYIFATGGDGFAVAFVYEVLGRVHRCTGAEALPWRVAEVERSVGELRELIDRERRPRRMLDDELARLGLTP